MWICPHCSEQLQLQQSNWKCKNNHSFDIAKEGYVNLLPVNQKRSKDPGDSIDMINARRRIHQQGLYAELANTLSEKVAKYCASASLLDIGCGEGFYANWLKEKLPLVSINGIDISKPGIKLAAKQNANISYAVASSYSLPVAADLFDIVMRVFAPSADNEVVRVLKPDGFYIQVTPATNHLIEIRNYLYNQARLDAKPAQINRSFNVIEQTELSYRFNLTNQLLRDLVAMTPFAHKGNKEGRVKLLEEQRFTVTMAFDISIFQKC